MDANDCDTYGHADVCAYSHANVDAYSITYEIPNTFAHRRTDLSANCNPNVCAYSHADGNATAIARGTVPPWARSMFGSELWGLCQAAARTCHPPAYKQDCIIGLVRSNWILIFKTNA